MIWNTCRRRDSVTNMLAFLGLQLLWECWKNIWLRLVLLFYRKYLYFNSQAYLSPLEQCLTRSDHGILINPCRIVNTTFMFFLFPETIDNWSYLRDTMVNCDTVELFAGKLERNCVMALSIYCLMSCLCASFFSCFFGNQGVGFN